MNVEILCIGDELLSGKTINSNATYLSEKMELLGYDVLYHSVVGDQPDRIKNSLDIALERADILLITGGLGPTDDDLTIETIADYFGQKLVFDQQVIDKITFYYNQMSRKISERSKKQAYRPEKATIINNNIGTAPGILLEFNENKKTKKKYNSNKIIAVYPGVPYEMKDMWISQSDIYFKQKSSIKTIVKDLKFIGIPESTLAEAVNDILSQSNPHVAPYVSVGEVILRIKSKASSQEEAERLLLLTETAIMERVSDYYYGSDNDSIQEIIGQLLTKNNLTLSVAESCTGGLISSKLTDISGSSSYIQMNMVTYSNEAKIKMLGVKEETINQFGPVSEKSATEMAEGIKLLSNSDIGLSITGFAGPTSDSVNKPVGLVYIGISGNNKTKIFKFQIPDRFNRVQIKERAAILALKALREFILEEFTSIKFYTEKNERSA